jgi:hypothetical protein
MKPRGCAVSLKLPQEPKGDLQTSVGTYRCPQACRQGRLVHSAGRPVRLGNSGHAS